MKKTLAILLFAVPALARVNTVSVKDLGARGDGSTNDTAAIQKALNAATALAGTSLYFPAGIYLTCNFSYSGAGNIEIYGDGMNTSRIVRHSSCLNAAADMLDTFTTGSVYLHDFGIDMVTGGATTFSKAAIAVSGNSSLTASAASLTVDHLYVANAQVVGLTCRPCRNATVTSSTFYKNWWFGLAFTSGGTTASPVYGKNFVVQGNTFIDQPIGVGFEFFLSNIAVTGNVFDRSNLSLVQMPHAYATVTGNTVNGVPDQGCLASGQCGTTSANYNGMFFEGVSDWDVGKNQISNVTASQGGFICQGSNLQIPIPAGTILDLPCSRWHIDGLTVSNSGGQSILVTGISNGNAPASGVQGSLKNTNVTGSNVCQAVTTMVGLDMSNNSCDSAANGGYQLGNIQNGSFRANTCRNCNTSGGAIYATGRLTATNGSKALIGSGTAWDGGMVGGGITIDGNTYQIASQSSATSIAIATPFLDTTASGLSYSIYYGGGGTVSGLKISGTSTLNLDVFDNMFQNDHGNSLILGIQDATTIPGQGAQIRHDRNMCSAGCTYGLYGPPVAIPTAGTWAVGNIVGDMTTSMGLRSWINFSAGTPGLWTCTTCGPVPIGDVNVAGSAAKIGLTTISTLPVPLGLYQLNWRVRPVGNCSVAAPASVVLALSYWNEVTNISTTLAVLSLGSEITAAQSGTINFWAVNNADGIQYQTTYTPCTTGTGSYALQMSLDRLR